MKHQRPQNSKDPRIVPQPCLPTLSRPLAIVLRQPKASRDLFVLLRDDSSRTSGKQTSLGDCTRNCLMVLACCLILTCGPVSTLRNCPILPLAAFEVPENALLFDILYAFQVRLGPSSNNHLLTCLHDPIFGIRCWARLPPTVLRLYSLSMLLSLVAVAWCMLCLIHHKRATQRGSTANTSNTTQLPTPSKLLPRLAPSLFSCVWAGIVENIYSCVHSFGLTFFKSARNEVSRFCSSLYDSPF